MSKLKPKIEIIGAPSDLGANMRGTCMGPSALRIAGLDQKLKDMGYEVRDLGDILVPVRESLPPQSAELKHRGEIKAICKQLSSKVSQSLKEGHMPLVIGGDHSVAIGTIGGVAQYFHGINQKMGLIWLDAHADVNTPESTPSGNIHGMPLSTVLGYGYPELLEVGHFKSSLRPQNVALIGIRMIDGLERDILRKIGIHYYSMRDIDEKGMPWVMEQAIAKASEGTSGIHISFDLDAIDPIYAPGVSTPVTGGLSFREAHLALEKIYESGLIRSLEFVEVNPVTDLRSQTAHLCIDLIQSALGKAIV